MYEVCNDIRMSTKYTVMKLPKNYDVDYLESNLHSNCQVDLVRKLQDKRGRVKMMIVVIKNKNGRSGSGSGSGSGGGGGGGGGSKDFSSSSSTSTSTTSIFLPHLNRPTPTTSLVDATSPMWHHSEAIKLFQRESKTPQLRGIYSFADEPSVAWRSATSSFPNPGCPNFPTKKECIAWCKHVRGTPSNPALPHLQHFCTTLIGWEQVEHFLLRKRDEYIRRYPEKSSSDDTSSSLPLVDGGRYQHVLSMRTATQSRLASLPHRHLTPTSSFNTLRYLYFHMRSGLYVMIRNGAVQMFVPFVNDEYTNTYEHRLKKFANGATQQKYDEYFFLLFF